jgi:D-xylose transport system permease protein
MTERPTANRLGYWHAIKRSLTPRSAGVVYAYLLLLIILSITSALQGGAFYLSAVNLSNILDQSTLVGILVVFMTIVLITGNFDLSVASTAALSGTLAIELVDKTGVIIAVLVALIAGVLVGALNAVLVQKVGVNAFIVTLGMLTAVRGVVEVILNGQSITANNQSLEQFSTSYWAMPQYVAIAIGVIFVAFVATLAIRSGSIRVLGKTQLLWVSGLALLAAGVFDAALLNERLSVWILLILVVVVSAVLRFTVVGRNIYAVGGNAEAARLSGINVDRYKMGAFILNGLVAAAVGVLYAGKFNSVDPTILTGTELTVIAAAVLGALRSSAGQVLWRSPSSERSFCSLSPTDLTLSISVRIIRMWFRAAS